MGYSTNWQPYENDYDKLEYDIETDDGIVYCNCYPNAGIFHSLDPKFKNGAGANIKGQDILKIRITPKENQILHINPNEVYEQTTR